MSHVPPQQYFSALCMSGSKNASYSMKYRHLEIMRVTLSEAEEKDKQKIKL